jgi:hypothetical protein
MALLVLAYPELAPEDRAWIEGIRAEYHLRHARVAAHFTLVYPVWDLDADAFVADVSRQAAGCASIPFVLRWALPFKDVTGEGTDVLLVPEEGFSALARLHDRLYAGDLAPRLRLDIPTIPHLTVAHSADPHPCKRLADALNARPVAIPGSIAALDLVVADVRAVRTIARLPLA